jgi:DNA-binding NtrC family response regulator
MFGHVKGSFTDAHRDKRGWLEHAHGGTIFMDEVGEMSLRMQAMILRFLETGEIQRVGSDRPQPPLDVRVVTATHRNLLERVADRSFREDLYYRLNVIHINVPALRERAEDIPLLLTHFLGDSARAHRLGIPAVTRDALECLAAYSWPGNVRELKNIAERLVLRASGHEIGTGDLPMEVRPVQRVTVTVAAPPAAESALESRLFDQMVTKGESFWSVVYEPFMARDLTRADLRNVVRLGLEHTRGNYTLLVAAFNMAPDDYKRFLNFLRKHQCHVPFQRFRVLPVLPGRPMDEPEVATA